jgi:hypothetical protein
MFVAQERAHLSPAGKVEIAATCKRMQLSFIHFSKSFSVADPQNSKPGIGQWAIRLTSVEGSGSPGAGR